MNGERTISVNDQDPTMVVDTRFTNAPLVTSENIQFEITYYFRVINPKIPLYMPPLHAP